MIQPRPTPLRVTDHAVLRYLERALGFDIEGVREHIRTICAPAAAIGATCLRAEGVRFEFTTSTNTVTTVVPDNAVPNATSRERARSKMRVAG